MQNKILIVSGNRGTGKTMLCSVFVGLNPEIKFYVNYKINKKNCCFYDNFKDLKEKLSIGGKGGVIILDESQKLLNSRKAMTETNMEVLQFVVESRKYNCDMILISQTNGDIDKQIREQADFIFELDSNPEGEGVSSLLTVKKKVRNKETGEIYFSPVNLVMINNLNQLMYKTGVAYDTNEIVTLNTKKNNDRENNNRK